MIGIVYLLAFFLLAFANPTDDGLENIEAPHATDGSHLEERKSANSKPTDEKKPGEAVPQADEEAQNLTYRGELSIHMESSGPDFDDVELQCASGTYKAEIMVSRTAFNTVSQKRVILDPPHKGAIFTDLAYPLKECSVMFTPTLAKHGPFYPTDGGMLSCKLSDEGESVDCHCYGFSCPSE